MMVNPQINVTVLAPVFPHVSQIRAVQWRDALPMEPWQAQLCSLIAQSGWDARHLPAAALYRHSKVGNESAFLQAADSALVCADPVHFRADRDSATLIPADRLQLRDSEADALLASINDFLQEDALVLGRTEAARWFMRGKDGSALASYPPSFLADRNASAYLPDGEDSRDWRTLMSELQMLLHAHPVNLERERQGRLPVNSVWFWGGAGLGSGKAAGAELQQSLRIYADDDYTLALSAFLGMCCEPLDAYDPSSEHARSLIVTTRLVQALCCEDEQALITAEEQMVNDWIAPLLARIERGDAIQLSIANEDGVQGLLNRDIVNVATAAQRSARLVSMSAGARLVEQLRGRAGNLWNTLTGKRQ